MTNRNPPVISQPVSSTPNLFATSRLITLMPDLYGNAYLGAGSYFNITAGLVDHSSYGPISSGGWQTVDRPKQVAATQWFDQPPYKLDLTILLDKSVTNPTANQGNIASKTHPNAIPNQNVDVEDYCNQLELWLEADSDLLRPPSLMINGPVPGTLRNWIVYSLEMTDAVRDFETGLRIQQLVKLTLYEFIPPVATINHTPNFSPAKAWVKNNNTTATTIKKLYTIQAGDNIQSIVTKTGGDNNSAAKILDANGLRDPSLIQYMLGEVIIIP